MTAYPRALNRRGGARKLRNAGRVPAVIYGGQTQPQNLEIDLKSLEDLIPDLAIEHTPLADYGWRAVVPRAAWSQVLVALLDELDYSNFKSAVASRQSVDRASLYARVWHTLRELQATE